MCSKYYAQKYKRILKQILKDHVFLCDKKSLKTSQNPKNITLNKFNHESQLKQIQNFRQISNIYLLFILYISNIKK